MGLEPLSFGRLPQGDTMRLRANDTFHSSETRTVRAGQEFEVTAVIGLELERRGLATVVDAGGEPEAKMEEAPGNKLVAAPPNKRGPGRPPKIKAEPDVEPEAEEGE